MIKKRKKVKEFKKRKNDFQTTKDQNDLWRHWFRMSFFFTTCKLEKRGKKEKLTTICKFMTSFADGPAKIEKTSLVFATEAKGCLFCRRFYNGIGSSLQIRSSSSFSSPLLLLCCCCCCCCWCWCCCCWCCCCCCCLSNILRQYKARLLFLIQMWTKYFIKNRLKE